MKVKVKAISLFKQGRILYYTISFNKIPPILTFYCIYFIPNSHVPLSSTPSVPFPPFLFFLFFLLPSFVSLLTLFPSPFPFSPPPLYFCLQTQANSLVFCIIIIQLSDIQILPLAPVSFYSNRKYSIMP